MFNVYYFFTMKLSNFKRLPNRIKYEFASSKRTRIFYVKISVRSTWTLKWTEYGAFRWWTWWILFILKFGSNWTSYKKNTQKLPKKKFDWVRFGSIWNFLKNSGVLLFTVKLKNFLRLLNRIKHEFAKSEIFQYFDVFYCI